MRARENKCQISQNDILHVNFSEFACVFTILVKWGVLITVQQEYRRLVYAVQGFF